MKKLVVTLLTVFLIVIFCCPAYPQQPQEKKKEIYIPDGVEFSAVTKEYISSKGAAKGDLVLLTVLDDVVVDGTAVIKKGTLVKGYVGRVRPARIVGTKGRLILNIGSTTTVDNQSIKLRGVRKQEGEGKKDVVTALGLLVGPFALLKHGSEAELAAGTVISVNTDEPKTVHVRASSGVTPSVNEKENPM